MCTNRKKIVCFLVYFSFQVLIGLKSFGNTEPIVIAYPVDSNWPDGLGLGNQFTTYSLAYYFSKKLETDSLFVYHNKKSEAEYQFNDPSNRYYGMSKFKGHFNDIENIDEFLSNFDESEIVNIDELSHFSLPKDYFSKFKVLLVKLVFKKEVTKFIDQYNDELKTLFEYKEKLSSNAQEILNNIQNSESASIHVRRGDTLTYGWSTPMPFYIQAAYSLIKINPDIELFIFSDDFLFVKEYIENKKNIENAFQLMNISDEEVKFINQKLLGATHVSMQINHSLEEFHLMSNCKYNIIPQSTFSWWAAFLNKNPEKIVIISKDLPHTKFMENFPQIPEEDGWIELSIATDI